jgi:hypothetical protein
MAVPYLIFSTWIVGCSEQNKKVDKTVQQGFEVGGARLALRGGTEQIKPCNKRSTVISKQAPSIVSAA